MIDQEDTVDLNSEKPVIESEAEKPVSELSAVERMEEGRSSLGKSVCFSQDQVLLL